MHNFLMGCVKDDTLMPWEIAYSDLLVLSLNRGAQTDDGYLSWRVPKALEGMTKYASKSEHTSVSVK